MDPKKHKSIALDIESFNKLWEMSDNVFPMKVSMAQMNRVLIDAAYKNWKDSGWKEFNFNPYPDLIIKKK